MAPLLARAPFMLLALCLWLLGTSASLAQEDDLGALNERIYKLVEAKKYQEALPLAEKAVEVARRLRGPEHPSTATSLNNLAQLYQAMGDYAKAELLYQEVYGPVRRQRTRPAARAQAFHGQRRRAVCQPGL